jgi:hypothetical protein
MEETRMAENALPELPYERIAMAGGEMPDDLTSADQQMFLELRLLYDAHKKGIVDREMAKKEKIKLLHNHQANVIMDNLTKQWAQQHIKTEEARRNYRLNRTLENADAIILAFEGVLVTFNEEAL